MSFNKPVNIFCANFRLYNFHSYIIRSYLLPIQNSSDWRRPELLSSIQPLTEYNNSNIVLKNKQINKSGENYLKMILKTINIDNQDPIFLLKPYDILNQKYVNGCIALYGN